MIHVVLLGDSIFDNKAYVGDGPDVIAQLREALPAGGRATLAAIDGAIASDVKSQLRSVPKDATHLVVSAGGNDALQEKGLIEQSARSVAEVLDKLAKVQAAFQQNYAAMLDAVAARKLPTAVCTIYEARYEDPAGAEDRRGGARHLQRHDPARGVRAPAAGDRSQADVRRRCRLRQRHRAFAQRRRQDRPRHRHLGRDARLHATAV